jgi:dUTPase
MKLFIKRVEGLTEDNLPKKANALDAGYDIIATTDPKIVIRDEKELKPDDVLKAAPLEDRPPLYKRVAYIEYGTNLYWTPEGEEELNLKPSVDHPNLLSYLDSYVRKVVTWHIEIFPRSSISKYNLVLANSVGTIDTGYANQVGVRFHYLFQPEDLRIEKNLVTGQFEIFGAVNQKYIYQKGNAICQMKPRKNEDIQFQFVDELPKVDSRGLTGWGDSGKNNV